MFEKKGLFGTSSRVRISGGSPRASECAARAVSTETESSITRCCRSLSLCSAAALCAPFFLVFFINTRGTHNGDGDDDDGGDTFINKYTHTRKEQGENKQTNRKREKSEAIVVWIETFPLALLRVIKELCVACQHCLMPTLADVVVPLNKI